MTQSQGTARLARALRQNAETMRLLGVDFMPVGRPPSAAPAPLPPPPMLPVAAEPSPQPVVEAKPGRPSKALASVPRPAVQGRFSREDAQALLDEVRARYEREAPHKQFVTHFQNIVFGEGDAAARVMFIGEAPGAEEDRTGRPFVGRAGQLLEKMINAMGLTRGQVYIANVLKTRPPDNATPTSDECALCAPYLYEQIMAIRPEAIVTLGLPASRTLLCSVESMTRLRGRWHEFRPPAGLADGRAAGAGLGPDWAVPVMPTYHPAFLLRSYTAENRGKVWSDLKQVMDRLGLESVRAAAPE